MSPLRKHLNRLVSFATLVLVMSVVAPHAAFAVESTGACLCKENGECVIPPAGAEVNFSIPSSATPEQMAQGVLDTCTHICRDNDDVYGGVQNTNISQLLSAVQTGCQSDADFKQIYANQLRTAGVAFDNLPSVCACYISIENDPLFASNPVENGVVCRLASTPTRSESQCRDACEEVASGEDTEVGGFFTPGSEDPVTAVKFVESKDSPQGRTLMSTCNITNQASAATVNANNAPKDFVVPQLSIPIPGVSFSKPLVNKDGTISVDFLGEYITGVYNFLLGAAATVAIVLLMIGGVRYILGAQTGDIKAAKEMITNAVTGLVLLLAVFVILFTINPRLTIFAPLTLDVAAEQALNEDASGPGGSDITAALGSSSTASNLDTAGELIKTKPECKAIIDEAIAKGQCTKLLPEGLKSPTGGPMNCGYHMNVGETPGGTRLTVDQFAQVKNMDFAASFDGIVRAPADGTVSYVTRAAGSTSRCGNTIHLDTKAGRIEICHMKDFTDDAGVRIKDGLVKQGDILGHVGGLCCGEVGENGTVTVPKLIPGGFSQKNSCTKTGKACSDPNTRDPACKCQPYYMSGNVSGPHVHLSLSGLKANADVLACVK